MSTPPPPPPPQLGRRERIAAMLEERNIREITSYDKAEISKIRVENCIGFTKVPIGIAGPLKVTGPNVQREVYAPLATYEATLVASCSRGCKALNAGGGGVHFAVLADNMIRAPVFRFDDPPHALAFAEAWPDMAAEFTAAAEASSGHLRLVRATVHVLGAEAHVLCQFHCGGAAGQNMVTKASDAAIKHLLTSPWRDRLQIRGHYIDGNLSSDKKASWTNVMRNRGTEVHAWGTLTDAACRSVLGCSSLQFYQAYTTVLHGGIRTGQFGANINTTNILAAAFIALGQDPGSIAEASWSHLRADFNPESQDILLSLYFPALPVAVVGGGTGLSTQKEARRILGCTEKSQKGELAGIIACFALALDISCCAAVANDTFAASHISLARGEPTKALSRL